VSSSAASLSAGLTAEFTAEDQEQLRILSIFHFVIAGLLALFGSVPVIHMVIGLSLLFSDQNIWAMDGGPPMALIGVMFTVIPALLIGLAWTTAILIVRAGFRLRQQRSHTFCLVMASVSCCFAPLGTVLGVFTILVLSRPGVRRRFSDSDDLAALF